RFCVIDHRMIVDVLVFGCYIQTIERTLGAFAVEHYVHVVANQAAAKRNRMRIEAARLMLMNLNGRDMKRVVAFGLQFVMIHDCIRANYYFGHRIVEIDALTQRYIILNDAGLAALAGDYQAPRMRSDRLVRGGNEQQVNRRFEDHAARDFNERPVFKESGVERNESLMLEIRVPRKVLLDMRRIALDCRR